MIVLDTNTVSELMFASPNSNVVNWVAQQNTEDLYRSAISEAELRYGAEILPTGRRRNNLLADIEEMVWEDFSGRILPFDSNAARAYAVIASTRRAAGQPISFPDCQIAAIARSLGFLVATRDARGFEGCGIEVNNPWSSD